MPEPPAATQLTGPAGKAPQPQKAPHQGFPRALSDRAGQCALPHLPTSKQVRSLGLKE